MTVATISGRDPARHGRTGAVTSTGQIWLALYEPVTDDYEFWYSNDGGSSFTQDTGAEITDAPQFDPSGGWAFFIDVNDNVFFLYKDNDSDHNIVVGTISGNAITWGTPYQVYGASGDGSSDSCDLVAFPYSGTTQIFMVFPYAAGNIKVERWTWSGSGAPVYAASFTGEQGWFPAIDFYHTGDGKTVKDNTPHVFFSWAASSNRLKFKKIRWTGSAWQEGTAQTIDTTWNFETNSGFFDGTRYVMAGRETGGGEDELDVWERDAADTSTTDLVGTPPTGHDTVPDYWGSYYDASTEDIYALGRSATGNFIAYNVYDRSAGSWDSAWTTLNHVEGSSGAIVNAVQNEGGQTGKEIIIVYGAWGGSTSVITDEVLLNEAPTAPTITSPTDGDVKDVAEVLPVVWTFNDPDPGDTQSAYSLRKQIGTGSYSYWNGSVFTASESAATKIASSGTTHTISSSWGADGDANHKYAIKTWDAADAGPSDWDEVYVTPSAQDNPTVTAITTVTAPTYSVTWTVATQTKYRVRVYDDSGGSPVTSTVFYDSGTLVSAVTSHSTPFPDNSVTRHVGVVTWNDEGLLSDEDTEQLAVSYLVPPTPTVSMSTTGSESGVIWVSINNPTPGGGETVTDSNDVYRRVAAEGGDGIRVAQGVAEDGGFNDYGPLSEVVYQYRARAVNAGLGTAAYGAWTT